MNARQMLSQGLTAFAVLAAAATSGIATAAGPPTADLILYADCIKRNYDVCAASALYTIDPRGSRPRLLIRNAAHGAWSPNGRQIAYVGSDNALWVARADGSARRRIARNHRDLHEYRPSWSPDGRRIVFARGNSVVDATLYSDLYSVELRTRRLTRLTRTRSVSEDDPAWSPDGGEIAYVRTAEDRGHGIFVLDVATGRSRRLTSGNADSAPDWSRDGTKVVFNTFPRAITVVRRDGTRRRDIVTGGWFGSPSWSPDASRIAYAWLHQERDFADKLLVAGAGGARRRVLVGNGEPREPDWRPRRRGS